LADLHIDDFCRDAALILLHLYGAFPRRASVYVEDICGLDTPDDVGLHSDRHMACLGTMLWLAEEDYLRFEAMIYQDGIDQAVQNIEDVGFGRHPSFEGQFDGAEHSLFVML